eukprot:3932178-Rhodomonas_salina.3
MGVHSYSAQADAGCSRGPSGALLPSRHCPLTWTPSPNLPLDLWRSALAHELFRPAPSTFREAARVKRRRVGFSSASAAVHIRRGDKVAGPDAQADATAVRGYVGAVRGLVAEVGGVRTLFVATDDDQAARDAVSVPTMAWRCPGEAARVGRVESDAAACVGMHRSERVERLSSAC